MKLFLISLISLLLFYKISSRIYESMEEIKKNILDKLSKLKMNVTITKDSKYYFNLNSKEVFFIYKHFTINGNSFKLERPTIFLKLYLSIYSNSSILNEENNYLEFFQEDYNNYFNLIENKIYILVSIELLSMTFTQKPEDHSFEFQITILNTKSQIKINSGGYNNTNFYTKELYYKKNKDDKDLYTLIKENVYKEFCELLRESLVLYPESDVLYYFNQIKQYILGNKNFFEYFEFSPYLIIDREKINRINYESISKIGTTIIFTKFNVKMDIFGALFVSVGEYDGYYENINLVIDNVKVYIDSTIEFGKVMNGEEFYRIIVEKIFNKVRRLIHMN